MPRKFDGIAVSEPAANEVVRCVGVFVPGDIGKTDKVVVRAGDDGDFLAADGNFAGGLGHGIGAALLRASEIRMAS